MGWDVFPSLVVNFSSHQSCGPDEGLKLRMNDDKVDDNKSVKLNNDKKKIKTTHTTDIPEKKVGLVTFENVPVRYT